MKTVLTTLALVASLGAAGAHAQSSPQAQEFGTLVYKTPVYAQVNTPQNQCATREQTVSRAPTGAGGLVGALVGGGIGNAFGGGAGRAAATGIGVLAGALIGDRVESDATPPVTTAVQECHVVNRVGYQVTGYDVVYEYKGQRYGARLNSDPGELGSSLALNLTPVGATPVGAAPVAATPVVTVNPAPAVVVNPAPVAVAVPAPVYVAPAYAGPRLSLSVGPVWGHGYGWGYGHWR